MNEFELKFQVPPEAREGVEAALRRTSVHRERLQAQYFDTGDGAFAQHGIVLRLRKEGRRWVQTAKAPGDGPFDRLEHNTPVTAAQPPVPLLERHDGTAVGDRLRRAVAPGESLQMVYAIDVVRLARLVETAGATVEIAFDRGHVRTAERQHPLCEIEFERKEGSTLATVELAAHWARDHGLWLDPVPKSVQGQRLASGQPAEPARAELPDRDFDDAAGWLAAVMASGLQQTLANAREVLAGEGHDEHVHQLRVGLRRLRTVLRELRGITELQSLAPSVESVLSQLFRVLGDHRDLSLLVPTLEAEIATAGGPPITWSRELPDLQAALRGAEVQQALLELAGWIQGTLEGGAATTSLKELRRWLAARLGDLHRQVRKDGARFAQLSGPQRHRVRKRMKRLRYLSELARPLFKAPRVDQFVDGLKHLQDELGQYQDVAAGRSLWTDAARDQPQAWFGAGWLAAREEALARRCGKVARVWKGEAKPFWRAGS